MRKQPTIVGNSGKGVNLPLKLDCILMFLNRQCMPKPKKRGWTGGGGGTGIEDAESGVEGAESGVEGAGSGSRGGGKRGNCGRGSGKIGGRTCFF